MCRAPVHNAKAPDPLLPHSRTNPIGGTKEIRETERIMTKHLARVRKWLQGQLSDIPTEVVSNTLSVNRRYEYLISLTELERIVAQLRARMVDARVSDAVVARVTAAYRQGTGAKALELARLSDDYTRSVTSALSGPSYQRRAALVGARVFEEMEGFSGERAKALSRVLMRAVEEGTNPRVVARRITAEFGESKSRALRIARTEITGALRRGRLDESRDAEEKFGIKHGQLWFSALSNTTRESHAELHGTVMTADEVLEFYSVDGNAINCKCSQSAVLLDEDGNPVSDKLVEREKLRGEAYINERKKMRELDREN